MPGGSVQPRVGGSASGRYDALERTAMTLVSSVLSLEGFRHLLGRRSLLGNLL